MHASLEMESVNFVIVKCLLHSPFHLRSVLSALVCPCAALKVKHSRLNAELSVNNESEASSLIEVDNDVSGDVVTKRKLG